MQESRLSASPVSMSDYDCVETYADWIQLLGDIYGEQDTANEIIAEGRSVAERDQSGNFHYR